VSFKKKTDQQGVYEMVVIYKGTDGNFLKNPKDRFFENLIRNYKIYNLLAISPMHCDSLYFFPFANNDNKYEYTLYHKKNKNGKYTDWEIGQKIKIRCKRYDQYYLQDSKRKFGPITVILDIKKVI
jgi:hypothetical protein